MYINIYIYVNIIEFAREPAPCITQMVTNIDRRVLK